MAAHRWIDRICCVILAFTLMVTVLFMNAETFGIEAETTEKGYESRLFDTASVHTINIIMDDWEDFLSHCTDEEYVQCTVVIDNETYKNVAIRAKGNTSLTQVASYGNDRYSFKIEFDHYDSTKTYYGLDKLCLNNIIQDNTYMKDYLTYQMMNAFGVDAPLCSYVNITVNGEAWGLYLAVEGIEEAFLERNYGNDYGELYKPDSQSMGGGRGNGEKFEMEDWSGETENTQEGTRSEEASEGNPGDQTGDSQMRTFGERGAGNMEAPGGFQTEGGMAADEATVPEATVPELPDGKSAPDFPEREDMPENGNFPEAGNAENMPDMNFPQGTDNGKGMGGMSSSDVSLIYSDDNYESYSNIFDNAKTEITDSDKDRLIDSLKQLNENSGIEEVVDVEEVIRYFVVHNFVCNFDSYTGSMIHNYYLYEKDGQMSMIPWDYNLAFGGFVGGSDATELVNYPIDTPVSGGTVESRPMLSWIFAEEEYTELYHQYFSEFISQYFDSGYFSEMIDSVTEMIAPYVEQDPTAFCTYEEFEAGAAALKEFCLLRAESVRGQLDGTIASVSGEQTEESLVDASEINLSDMGSMNSGKNGGMGFVMEKREQKQSEETSSEQSDPMEEESTQGSAERDSVSEAPDISAGQPSEEVSREVVPGRGTEDMTGRQTSENTPMEAGSGTAASALLAGLSVLVLAAGLAAAFLYRKRS